AQPLWPIAAEPIRESEPAATITANSRTRLRFMNRSSNQVVSAIIDTHPTIHPTNRPKRVFVSDHTLVNLGGVVKPYVKFLKNTERGTGPGLGELVWGGRVSHKPETRPPALRNVRMRPFSFISAALRPNALEGIFDN